MHILEKIRNGFTFLDGGTGTALQKAGLPLNELPERFNLTHPEVIVDLQLAYINAGSHIINTNTFGANCLKFSDEELGRVIAAAVANAGKARELSGRDDVYIALDVGPTGKLLKPFGELDIEDAAAVFAKTVRIGAALGVDLITIETMTDCGETKAAVIAAKENCDLPVFVTNVYNEHGRLMSGTDIPAMTAMLEGLGADAIGVNCSLGPEQMKGLVGEFVKCSSLPVIIKPNAGMPKTVDGRLHYDIGPEEFAAHMAEAARNGAVILGGCCGTEPPYIAALKKAVEPLTALPVTRKDTTVVSSRSRAVTLGNTPVIIGERINPTGKKKLREALSAGDTDYVLDEGFAQQEAGAHILDVNVGVPSLDEKKLLPETVDALQSVIGLPLQIDTSDPEAMERAMRRYLGKPMVNSVNGKRSSLESVLPLVKKYGGVIVGLTLDENGIPDTVEGRLAIARRIINAAGELGIAKKDVVIDPLTMTVSTDPENAKRTLECVRRIKSELGVRTVLGVSNVSFGLPKRSKLTGAFFTLAMSAGLDAGIVDPLSGDVMSAYRTYTALTGADEGFREYISFCGADDPAPAEKSAGEKKPEGSRSSLGDAVLKGASGAASEAAAKLIADGKKPDEIISGELIPALNEVGALFETGKYFLPQLLMSADAAGAAFDLLKAEMKKSGAGTRSKGRIVLATVKGDIHDIGKNIVRAILENYGYDVIDLGKDVAPETVLEAVKREDIRLCGLSALMTTTVPAMEETIKLLNAEAPFCKTVVGGAVLTAEHAEKIGADFYARDAVATVKAAEEVFGG